MLHIVATTLFMTLMAISINDGYLEDKIDMRNQRINEECSNKFTFILALCSIFEFYQGTKYFIKLYFLLLNIPGLYLVIGSIN